MTHILSTVRDRREGVRKVSFPLADCGTRSNLKICLPEQEWAQALEKMASQLSC